jgi:hypothetical protein
MNKRIQELAEQAFNEYESVYKSDANIPKEFTEKFAELIIRDCINCAKEWYDARISDSARDYSRGYVHGCDEAIAEMKKRFGVKE